NAGMAVANAESWPAREGDAHASTGTDTLNPLSAGSRVHPVTRTSVATPAEGVAHGTVTSLSRQSRSGTPVADEGSPTWRVRPFSCRSSAAGPTLHGRGQRLGARKEWPHCFADRPYSLHVRPRSPSRRQPSPTRWTRSQGTASFASGLTSRRASTTRAVRRRALRFG